MNSKCQERLDNLMILSCEADIPVDKNNVKYQFTKSLVITLVHVLYTWKKICSTKQQHSTDVLKYLVFKYFLYLVLFFIFFFL